MSHRELVTRAIGVLPMAYAPYSRFSVGAALQDTRGRVFLGCNIAGVKGTPRL
ncbi:MAG: hypothetical protein LBF64_04110 [Oscillospiraceae bacterium]|nr:hypothetical protein [Oscillospiraceae bacterium]